MKRIAVCLPLLLACSSETNPGTPDADVVSGDADTYVDPYPCWPEGVVEVPHGSLELGGGRGGFHELTDPYPLEAGITDGFMFVVQVRMTGFEPGDPDTFGSGPRTRIRAFFDETDVALQRFARCGFRQPYVDNGSGAYELAQEYAVAFDTCWHSDRLLGQRIRIEAEIKDVDGRYASATRVITAGEPLSEYPMEQDSAPCPP